MKIIYQVWAIYDGVPKLNTEHSKLITAAEQYSSMINHGYQCWMQIVENNK